MVGREEGGPPVRRPLRSGRAIKVFAHEEVEAEEPGERRACKKEKSRGRSKGKIMRGGRTDGYLAVPRSTHVIGNPSNCN